MSDALSIAVNGLNASVARTTQSVGNIVNASSTGNNLDANLVKISAEKTNIAADADVIKTVRKEQQSLIDILT